MPVTIPLQEDVCRSAKEEFSAPEVVEERPSAPTEREFYLGYDWCLNAYPTVREAIAHLRRELTKPLDALESWQRQEVWTNIFLLSCGVVSTAEDYLPAPRYRLPRRILRIPFSRLLPKCWQKAVGVLHGRRCRPVREWKTAWDGPFADFLSLLTAEFPDADALDRAVRRLANLPPPDFPHELLEQTVRVPSGFRRHDLTHYDVVALGERFAAAFPDRRQPLVVVGPRTSGSYLAPILYAFLKNAGYARVDLITVRPKQEPTKEERRLLSRCASDGCRVVLVDDPPGTGETIVVAVRLLQGAGFASDRIVALLPIHPTAREWQTDAATMAPNGVAVVCLPQEEWYKSRQLDSSRVEPLLQHYFQQQGWRRARIVPSAVAERMSAQFHRAVETTRGTRLKRLYEVRLEDDEGRTETRLILAKSVGWGWLGYHAFTAGERLASFTPPILGLRDGILYSEWQTEEKPPAEGREPWIDAAADYVAERVRSLRLPHDPVPALVRQQGHRGLEMLAPILLGAYPSGPVRALTNGRLRARLAAVPNPFPTLIDGRMRAEEWIQVDGARLKTDFEHHGLGKYEINVADPAYDLADFIHHFDLSAEEEARFLDRYDAQSGDKNAAERLFLYKLLAGVLSRNAALNGLETPFQIDRQQEFHQRFVQAWNFLTIQSVRHCGRYCGRPPVPSWRSPLAALDIDGVLDRRLFGYPCTSAAGMEALALLHAHGFTVVMNSARSALEVREYCKGYGFAGGVGEYGSSLWDAVAGRERILVTPESAMQLEGLRRALAGVPGVFLNDTYARSIRANVY